MGQLPNAFSSTPIKINSKENIYIFKSIGWPSDALFPRCDRKGVR